MNRKNRPIFDALNRKYSLTTAYAVYMWRFFSTLERVALADDNDRE